MAACFLRFPSSVFFPHFHLDFLFYLFPSILFNFDSAPHYLPLCLLPIREHCWSVSRVYEGLAVLAPSDLIASSLHLSNRHNSSHSRLYWTCCVFQWILLSLQSSLVLRSIRCSIVPFCFNLNRSYTK